MNESSRISTGKTKLTCFPFEKFQALNATRLLFLKTFVSMSGGDSDEVHDYSDEAPETTEL